MALFFIERLSPLYEDVQTSGIFPDSKYFVDAVPLHAPEEILASYAAVKQQPGFDLKSFVQTNFRLPAEGDNGYQSAEKPLPEHLARLWDVLTRRPDEQGGTLIPLPYPYIVPGGRFREVYYWDSYFTMLGLKESGRFDIIRNMLDNFAHLIDTVGFIPNGNRTYYLGRSQPPFFTQMVMLLAGSGDGHSMEVLQKYLPQIEKEYAFWMDGKDRLNAAETAYRRVVRMPNGTVMNRYWDDNDTPRPEAFAEDLHLAETSGRNAAEVYRNIRAAAESGWDFSSRWFRDGKNMTTIQTTDLVPVDLNCLLVFVEVVLSDIYESAAPEKAQRMKLRAVDRLEAIREYCWNEGKGFYFDYHFGDREQAAHYTLAGLYPLFIPLSDEVQAERVAAVVEEKFLQPGGLTTTLLNSGQQWDAPNGWAPLQWIAYHGLKQASEKTAVLAEKIRQRWMHNNEKVYASTGKMMEKYNVTDTTTNAGGGEYPNQDGFGWTNGVYLAMRG